MRSAFLFLVLLIVSTVAAGQPPDGVSLMAQGQMNGPMHHWEIAKRRFEAQPRWQPSNPTLPLPIPKALEAAEAWIKKQNPEVKNFSVATIGLAPMGCCSNTVRDRWYFRVEFNPVVGGQVLYGGQYIAVVLFDGSIVEPRTEKRN